MLARIQEEHSWNERTRLSQRKFTVNPVVTWKQHIKEVWVLDLWCLRAGILSSDKFLKCLTVVPRWSSAAQKCSRSVCRQTDFRTDRLPNFRTLGKSSVSIGPRKKKTGAKVENTQSLVRPYREPSSTTIKRSLPQWPAVPGAAGARRRRRALPSACCSSVCAWPVWNWREGRGA